VPGYLAPRSPPPPLLANIGKHVPAIQIVEKHREREGYLVVSARGRGGGGVEDPNTMTSIKFCASFNLLWQGQGKEIKTKQKEWNFAFGNTCNKQIRQKVCSLVPQQSTQHHVTLLMHSTPFIYTPYYGNTLNIQANKLVESSR
jgi:hypothetical protein